MTFKPYRHKKMRTLRRIIILSIASLFIGILVNQLHSKGIRWQILMLSIPNFSKQAEWTYVSSDSAFGLFLQQAAIFVDIRPKDEFEIDHIPGALSLPFFEFFDQTDIFSKQDKDATYILYDLERNSRKVRLLTRQLRKYGLNEVAVLRGGFTEWLYMTFPVEPGGV